MNEVDPKEVERLKAAVLRQLDGNAWNQVRVAWVVEENDAQHEGRIPTIPTVESAGLVGAGTEPLTESQQEVFDLIATEGPFTGNQILRRMPQLSSESNLTTHYVPALKAHGVRNRRGLGYYLPQ